MPRIKKCLNIIYSGSTKHLTLLSNISHYKFLVFSIYENYSISQKYYTQNFLYEQIENLICYFCIGALIFLVVNWERVYHSLQSNCIRSFHYLCIDVCDPIVRIHDRPYWMKAIQEVSHKIDFCVNANSSLF